MQLQDAAPVCSLPGVADGDITTVDIASHVGDAVVLLVFYPSTDGPYAGQSAAVLRACAHLADQARTEVEPLGIAPESVYSQRRFAEEEDLSLTLLSDPGCDLIDEYGVAERRSSGQTVATLSVFAIDYSGLVIYTWTASGPQETPPTSELQTTVANASPTQSAHGAYRLGYTQFQEGRRHLSRGLAHCESHDWVQARSEFADACDTLAEATDKFILSQGLAADDLSEIADRGRRRATGFWQAAEWLAGYATAAKNTNEERRRTAKQNAETLLTEVRTLQSLPEPEDVVTGLESPPTPTQ